MFDQDKVEKCDENYHPRYVIWNEQLGARVAVYVRVYGNDLGMHRIRAAALVRARCRKNGWGRYRLLASGGANHPPGAPWSLFTYVPTEDPLGQRA